MGFWLNIDWTQICGLLCTCCEVMTDEVCAIWACAEPSRGHAVMWCEVGWGFLFDGSFCLPVNDTCSGFFWGGGIPLPCVTALVPGDQQCTRLSLLPADWKFWFGFGNNWVTILGGLIKLHLRWTNDRFTSKLSYMKAMDWEMACACEVNCSTSGELMNMMIQVMDILSMMGYDIVSYEIKTRPGGQKRFSEAGSRTSVPMPA